MTNLTADVVVVGGGAIGTSIAMHLALMDSGRVVLVEQGHLAGGASGLSGAMVREHYLHPVLVSMAMESRSIFHNFADVVGGDARFRQTGRLLLFPQHDELAVRANVAMNRDLGVNIETLAPSELARIVPNMSIDGVAVGAYEPESGYADPVATTYAYARRARDHGAEILTQTSATGLAASSGRVTGVETDRGLIATPAVVVATGPWCNRLAASVGESLPVTPIRVQMVSFRRPPMLETLTATVIDHATGAYFRADSDYRTLVGGEAPEDLGEVADPDSYDPSADQDMIASLWDRARQRFPDFAAAVCRGGYGALYDMTPDGNPILDRSRTVEGLFWAAGFSGHGFKLSPVIGRMVAELVLHGESRGHPVSRFSADRFASGEPLEAERPYHAAGHP
jgi:sarcosine oxidase subunit beta